MSRRPAIREERVELADPDVSVRVRRRAGVRRVSLSVSRIDGSARVTAPIGCSAASIRAFLDGHRPWLRETLSKVAGPIALAEGEAVPYRGELIRLTHAPGRAVRLDREGARLLVGGPRAALGRKALVWLREEARARLLARSTAHAEALDLQFRAITIRDTRSRWGSCSADGRLSYCWRLVLAPDDVLDYVAAHEVAHLREMNHSDRFWRIVAQRRPDWRIWRDWLRRHGSELHRYQAPQENAAPTGASHAA